MNFGALKLLDLLDNVPRIWTPTGGDNKLLAIYWLFDERQL